MKRGLLTFAILILLLTSVVYAQNLDDIITADYAVLNVKTTSNFEIVPTDSSYAISYLEAKTSFYPRDSERETIERFKVTPSDYDIEDEMISFRWDDPYKSQYSYIIEADVRTSGKLVQVKKEIPFPRQDDLYPEYVEATEHIDSDKSEIQEIAQALIQGKDDYYDVVLTLAEWVHHNINYNLSTLTAEVTQPASWVLRTREGVCDEMTSLFIAFLRAVNIPARYVSGVSYTNSDLFDYDFGAHGWAEVYFPEYGWIPFDATYGEYGYVDASHVVMRRSKDSGEPSTFYGWRGRNVKVDSSKLQIDTEIIEMGSSVEENFDITPTSIKKNIGFGSYNLIEATIKNKKNYYIPVEMHLSRVQNMEIHSLNPAFLLFRPGETKKVYWIVSVSNKLSNQFTYTFPFSVYTTRNESEESSFKVSNDYATYTRQDIETLMNQKMQEFEKTYSQQVMFYCEPTQDLFYQDETVQLNCNLKNLGDVGLNDVDVCVGTACYPIDVNANTEEKFTINLAAQIGEKEYIVTASNDEISKSDTVTVEVMKYPRVSLKEIDFPEKIDYNKDFQVKFTISGQNNPVDLKVNLHVNRMSKTWRLDNLNIDRQFIINVNSKDLYPKNNNISVKVVYDDVRDKSYRFEKSYTMELTNLNWWQKIILYSKMYLERGLNK
jgi:transglutaminase-like putative cysteine protease